MIVDTVQNMRSLLKNLWEQRNLHSILFLEKRDSPTDVDLDTLKPQKSFSNRHVNNAIKTFKLISADQIHSLSKV